MLALKSPLQHPGLDQVQRREPGAVREAIGREALARDPAPDFPPGLPEQLTDDAQANDDGAARELLPGTSQIGHLLA